MEVPRIQAEGAKLKHSLLENKELKTSSLLSLNKIRMRTESYHDRYRSRRLKDRLEVRGSRVGGRFDGGRVQVHAEAVRACRRRGRGAGLRQARHHSNLGIQHISC